MISVNGMQPCKLHTHNLNNPHNPHNQYHNLPGERKREGGRSGAVIGNGWIVSWLQVVCQRKKIKKKMEEVEENWTELTMRVVVAFLSDELSDICN